MLIESRIAHSRARNCTGMRRSRFPLSPRVASSSGLARISARTIAFAWPGGSGHQPVACAASVPNGRQSTNKRRTKAQRMYALFAFVSGGRPAPRPSGRFRALVGTFVASESLKTSKLTRYLDRSHLTRRGSPVWLTGASPLHEQSG